MASAKMGTKAKIKDERGKTPGSMEEPDGALLRKPIQTSITGFAQARKIFDSTTEELKSLLTTECDLLYECKVCRNLFRSLANFIAHKRVYCKETFNSSVHGHFIKPVTTMSEIMKIRSVEEGYQDYIRSKVKNEPDVPRDRIPLSKDMTAVVENLMKNGEATAPTDDKGPMDVAVQKIPTSSVAVFQNLVKDGEDRDDMCSEVIEIDNFMAKDSAILKEDGKFETCAEKTILDKESLNSEVADKKKGNDDDDDDDDDRDEDVIQISDDDESGRLVCKICDIKFSTRKTHKFHMKYKHVADRLVYPCTDCCDIFSTSWSVLRHLYRVHRKTLTQIRRMREVVQSRAFRMDNMPMSYVKKKNIKDKVTVEEKLTEDERIDQENQAWMDNMESDSELPRCGGCGRSFERRAALAAHTYTCQSRTRALAKKPALPDRAVVRRDPKSANKQSDGGAQKATDKEEAKAEDEEKMDTDEVIQDDNEIEIEKSPKSQEQNAKEEEDSGIANVNPQDEAERGNMEALKKKMAEYLDKSGSCKLCSRKYSTPSHLCRHMATHLAWRRYGCKLCNYSNYDRNRLVTHAQTIHKLRGSEEFYASIIRIVTAEEALSLSTTPNLTDGEWNKEDEESSEEENLSSDESESSSSRTEVSRVNRRKQTFKSIKVKSKSTSPAKEDEKTEKSSKQSSIEKEEHKKNQAEKKDDSSTDSGRPVRKRMRPKKDKDFEYDFSNLMRWEASAYREREANASRNITNKRKSNAESSPSDASPEKVEKNEKETKEDKAKVKVDEKKKKSYAGALATMSDRAVAQCRAHLKLQVLPFPADRTKTPSEVAVQFRRKLINTVVDVGRGKSDAGEPTPADKATDAEKQPEESTTPKRNIFKPTITKPLIQATKSKEGKPQMVVVKQIIVSRDSKAKSSTNLQFQKLHTIPVKLPAAANEKSNNVDKPQLENKKEAESADAVDVSEQNNDKAVTENGSSSLPEVAQPGCIEIT